jgi:hypothetical protein
MITPLESIILLTDFNCTGIVLTFDPWHDRALTNQNHPPAKAKELRLVKNRKLKNLSRTKGNHRAETKMAHGRSLPMAKAHAHQARAEALTQSRLGLEGTIQRERAVAKGLFLINHNFAKAINLTG